MLIDDMIPDSYWVKANGFTTSVYIQYRTSEDRPTEASGWSINCRSSVWDKEAKDWVYEPMPSNRDDDFIKNTRFSLREAADIVETLKEFK